MDSSSDSSSALSLSEEGEAERGWLYDSDDEDPMRSFLPEYQITRSANDRERLERVMLSLKEEFDPSGQVASLTELCELLSYCTGDSFSNQISASLSPLLVKLSDHGNPDIVLLAVRAMTYMCDVYPLASSFLVRQDAVNVLCGKLMAIEYVDVAEQCLQALEKISLNQPLACLEAGAVMAVLRYIDFFSTSAQRVAVSTVVNICRTLPSEYLPSFVEAVPTLCNLLQYEDQQLVENVAVCITRIAERVGKSSELLDELCQHGLVHQVMHLIDPNSRASLSKETCNGFIGLLAKLCSGSIPAFRTLYELNISSILKDLFSSPDISHGIFLSALVDGPHNQVHEVLKLLHELLPTSARNQDVQELSDKESFLISRPDLLHRFAVNMLPLLFQVVNSGASIHVCYGCLSVIDKLVYLCKSDKLIESLKNANIGSFLAGVIFQRDPHVQILALKCANVILQRHSDAFLDSFTKEGIFFAIDALSTSENRSEVMFPPVSSAQLPVDLRQEPNGKGLVQCLCYAFSTVLDPSPSELGTCKLEEDSVVQLAKQIKNDHTPCGPKVGVTDILKKLKNLDLRLNDLIEMHRGCGTYFETKFELIFKEIMSHVSGRENASTFEFIESGIVKSLVNYLFSDLNGRGVMEGNHTRIRVVERRLEIFARVFLSTSDESAEASPLTVLTRKLNSALSVSENFPVFLNHAAKRKTSFATVPNGCVVQHPCLKVCFVRDEGETCLADYSNDFVTVDPFCSLGVVEGFLWHKVHTSGTDQVKSPHSAVSHTEILPQQISSVANFGQGNGSSRKISTGNQHEPTSSPEMQESGSKLSHFGSELEREIRQENPAGSSLDRCLDVLYEAAKKLSTQTSASCSPNDTLPKLFLCLDGHTLDDRLTLYQAILQQQMKAEPDFRPRPDLWSQVHTITYKRAVRPLQDNLQETIMIEQDVPHGSFMSSGYATLVSDLKNLNPSDNILLLLKTLEEMNSSMFHFISREQNRAFAEARINNLDDMKVIIPRVPQKEFLSSKLTEKLEQQMRDNLAVSVGAMPLWWSQLMTSCPFLFSFNTKCKYFRLAAFGMVQSESQLSSQSSPGALSDRRVSTSSSPHSKFVVNRERILESATQIMDLHVRNKVPIEVQYSGEVGFGLGPTLEFYTLISHEFQKSGLGMWRDEHISYGKDLQADCSRAVLAPFGLFPRPWPSNLDISDNINFTEVINKFVLLGQVVAKALQEGRMLDLPFSKSFYKVIKGQELTVYDIPSFDPELGKTLLEFQALVERNKVTESEFGRKLQIGCNPCYRDINIEDMCLDFTLPGYPDYVFTTDPDSTLVNMSNLDSYITHIVDATIHNGISRQVQAFKCGFNEVFRVKNLEIFTEEELEHLLCGQHESWTFDELIDHIKFDHGYTASSPPIVNVLELIQEFDHEQRRALLRFVTGAPRLPPGGLASLNPKLTIVRKHSDNPADTDLPSVMTCANYLKLPPYSSKELMKEKLLYAITEGQGSFHLS